MKVKELTREEIIRALRAEKDTLKKYNVKRIGLFGSFARGEQTQGSDVDILVEFKEGESVGFDFFHLADHLERILGVKVDLVEPEGIKPNRRPYIMEDLIYV